MKPSSTGYGVSLSGVGRRLDPPSPEWFTARVDAASTAGGHNVYDLVEVQPDLTGFGYEDKPLGLLVAGAWEVNDAVVDEGAIVRARFRGWNQGGIGRYEFWTGGGSGVGKVGFQDTVHCVAGANWPADPLDVSFEGVERDGAGNLIVSSPPRRYGKPTPFALIAHTATSGGVTGGTTPAVNTTGATLIVAFAGEAVAGTISVTDNKGNTYLPLTPQSAGAVEGGLYYCIHPVVGTGHTFTVGGTNVSMEVAAFSGSIDAFDAENGAAGAGVALLDAGSVTPARSGDLFVTGAALGASGSPTVDSGFTITDTETYSAGDHIGSSLAYKIQTTPNDEEPTWTFAGVGDYAAAVACFKVKPVGRVYEHANLPWRCVDPPDGTVSHEIPLFADPSSGSYAADPASFVGYVYWGDWYSTATLEVVTNVIGITIDPLACTGTAVPVLTSYDFVQGFFNTPSLVQAIVPTPPPPPP